MVRLGNTLLVCGTKPMPWLTSWLGLTFVMSWPSSVTLPVRTLTSPKSAFSSVDLPAPLGPMMPTSSPSLGVEVAAGEDVDAGEIAGDEVVRDDQGFPRSGQVCGAVPFRLAQVVVLKRVLLRPG